MIRCRTFFAIALSAFAVTLVFALLFSGILHYTEQLRVGEFRRLGEGAYSVELLDRAERTVGKVYVQLSRQSRVGDRIPLLVSIWHVEDVELDSLRLVLSGQDFPVKAFLEAPTYTLSKCAFHSTGDGLGAVFEAEDLGIYGDGTVNLKFLLYSIAEDNLKFKLDISMHRLNSFPLRVLRASIDATIPIRGETRILCPRDGGPYVWTPIGSRSENFNWRCLECGYHWMKTYPEEVYRSWRTAFLNPEFVRDYTILYLREVEKRALLDPLELNWTVNREERPLGKEIYTYLADGLEVKVAYRNGQQGSTVYEVEVKNRDELIWEGKLYQRKFNPTANNIPRGVLYETYGCLGVFKEGVYITATESNPIDLLEKSDLSWEDLKDHRTLRGSRSDYVAIVISRGDLPTGGYSIKLRNVEKLEGEPTVLYLTVDFIDPGKDVIVTQAFTNPTVLIPLGNLPEGKYLVEVHVNRFILAYNGEGKPVYTPAGEEFWNQSFQIDH
ncbi:protease complex subunit PrcB family protein [Candidatus Bathyarchaeota archaeon]|nr:protease complex subunit PrcB family protein [Candidatus Bathyarchaeota archaeon]